MDNVYNPFSLSGKTVLVTGASSGIGRAIAIECSKMRAQLVITGRNVERLNETLSCLCGENHVAITADLSTEDGIEKVAAECPAITGVVHSAGVGGRGLLKAVREKEIERIMKVNFNSPVLLQRALLKKKKIKDSSSIVFIASRAPFAPAMGNGIYSASKGALMAYAKVLGLELIDRLVRVNTICPGIVLTDMSRADMENMGVDAQTITQKYPLKRLGEPQDVAYLTVYLLSDASSWMTGSCIDIAGGGEFTLQ